MRRPLITLALALTLSAAAAHAQGYPQPSQPPYSPQSDPNADPNLDPTLAQNPNAPDPPSRVARLSVLQGDVSLQPAEIPDFHPAEANYPLTDGDRLYTAASSLAELESGQLALRLAPATDLTVTRISDSAAQFGLASGSVHLRTYSLDPSFQLELDTPNAAVTVLSAGDLRVDVSPDGQSTTVTLLSGAAQLQANGFGQNLRPGQPIRLSGLDQVYAARAPFPPQDDLDIFSSSRDAQFAAVAAESGFVDPATPGAEDLAAYGDWSDSPDFGAVWYPRGLAAGWRPYSAGHWVFIRPWGWTWVGAEPWGFAPFHYGRWALIDGRWAWVPGRPIAHPVYSPALVVFVGGGRGVTAWFPLGPREIYQPWYHTSPLYMNRVNVTNIYYRDPREARRIYDNRATVVFHADFGQDHFANRDRATVAIRADAFAGGRPVRESMVRFNPADLNRAPVTAHPIGVEPTRAAFAPGPARSVPVADRRPPLANTPEPGRRNGFSPQSGNQSGNQPGNQPAPAVGTWRTGTPNRPAINQPGSQPGQQRNGPPNNQQPNPQSGAGNYPSRQPYNNGQPNSQQPNPQSGAGNYPSRQPYNNGQQQPAAGQPAPATTANPPYGRPHGGPVQPNVPQSTSPQPGMVSRPGQNGGPAMQPGNGTLPAPPSTPHQNPSSNANSGQHVPLAPGASPDPEPRVPSMSRQTETAPVYPPHNNGSQPRTYSLPEPEQPQPQHETQPQHEAQPQHQNFQPQPHPQQPQPQQHNYEPPPQPRAPQSQPQPAPQRNPPPAHPQPEHQPPPPSSRDQKK